MAEAHIAEYPSYKNVILDCNTTIKPKKLGETISESEGSITNP